MAFRTSTGTQFGFEMYRTNGRIVVAESTQNHILENGIMSLCATVFHCQALVHAGCDASQLTNARVGMHVVTAGDMHEYHNGYACHRRKIR